MASTPDSPEEKVVIVEEKVEAAASVVVENVINIEEMAREKERQEKEVIETYIAESRARQEWKEKLRSKNQEAEANR